MLSDIVEKRINEISTISDELSHIVPRDGWTDYAIGLAARMQKLAIILDDEDDGAEARIDGMFDAFKDAWMSTKDGRHIHVGKDGNPDKGNPHLLEAIEGAMKSTQAKERKRGMKCEKPVTFNNEGAITHAKSGWKVTHFSHDENEMRITKQVRDVQDGTGQAYKICRGAIEHLTVFASDEVGRGVDLAEELSKSCGGDVKKWKHVKGIGTVVDKDGRQRKADLHWFENPETGQVGWKIKKFLEDMDESEIYW